MMVILELLARAYGNEQEVAGFEPLAPVDSEIVNKAVKDASSVKAESEDRLRTSWWPRQPRFPMASARSCRLMTSRSVCFTIRADGTHITIAACIAAVPVATGSVNDDTLVCPWHGFEFDVTTGECLADPSARLDRYPVEVRDGQVYLEVPDQTAEKGQPEPAAAPPTAGFPGLKPNEFRVGDIPAGQIRLVHVGGDEAAVYNADGVLYATQGVCTHRGGPLSEGDLAGHVVTCPLHGSQFDVTTGRVVQGPAEAPLKCFRVTVEGDIGRVEPIR